jgi:hypothetical protein
MRKRLAVLFVSIALLLGIGFAGTASASFRECVNVGIGKLCYTCDSPTSNCYNFKFYLGPSSCIIICFN